MKKGYVFTLDAIVAVIILIIGSMIIYYPFPQEKNTIYFTEQVSQDVMGVLEQVKVTELCSGDHLSGWTCNNYPILQQVLNANPQLDVGDSSVLELFAEMIFTGTRGSNDVEEIIHEIFVTNQVIDERRLGFAVIYTDLAKPSPVPLEIYNTEMYVNP
jgi:hypothetical protein